ncbi:MAG: UDP-N-acetylmuramate dehydrogenase [Clostridia bacterium]|nr:UDP-N-acetylmuramate dehydrogenase [Clostridia bacterium]
MKNRLTEELLSYKVLSGTPGLSVLTDEPMSNHSTFRIGGPADYFITPRSEEDLLFVLSKLKEFGERTLIIGKGSNVLFADEGYRGAVVCTSSLDRVIVNGSVITAECGASLTSVARQAARHSLSGLEFAFGIPGSVGGAVFMNAGAYGGEISSVTVKTKTIDPETFEIRIYEREEHEFGYRESVFRRTGDIILSTELCLTPGDAGEINGKMTDFLERRQQKQPLEFPSAGSVFKRCAGRFTGQMIEESGLKGLTVGGAQVSEKHAGFIINVGDATARDVLELIDIIKETVKTRFGCSLECELIYVS